MRVRQQQNGLACAVRMYTSVSMTVQELDKTLCTLVDKLVALLELAPDDPADLRTAPIGNLILKMESTVSALRAAFWLTQNIEQNVCAAIVKCTHGEPQLVTHEIREGAKLNLVLAWMFQIDHFLGRVGLELRYFESVKKTSFPHLELFTWLGITNPLPPAKALRILQTIRNSLHNNGLHEGNSMTFSLLDRKYAFLNGQPVLCAGWDDLIPLLDSSIDTIGQVLRAERVKKMQATKEPYAALFGAEHLTRLKAEARKPKPLLIVPQPSLWVPRT